MVLKKCKECGNDISTKAMSCPKCGAIFKKNIGCLGCVGVAFLIFITIGIISFFLNDGAKNLTSNSSSSKPEQSSSIQDLNATVGFDDIQFIIVNKNVFDWRNVKLEINDKAFSSGYVCNIPLIKAGNEYTIGSMQFAKSNGERFNPFTYKVLSLSIWCDTPKGKGFYYGTWK